MSNSIMSNLANSLEGSVLQYNEKANVGKTERIISVGTGAFIALKGISNLFSSPLLALSELVIGGGLVYRGITGYCAVKQQIDGEDDDFNEILSQRVIATEVY